MAQRSQIWRKNGKRVARSIKALTVLLKSEKLWPDRQHSNRVANILCRSDMIGSRLQGLRKKAQNYTESKVA